MLLCSTIWAVLMNIDAILVFGIYFFRYILLLHQYEAVSFGDALFGSYLLLPLQQRHALRHRRAIWLEHNMVIRTLSVPLMEVSSSFIPYHKSINEVLASLEVLRYYLQWNLTTSHVH